MDSPEPANFLAAQAPDFIFQAAPAPAPDFFPKRLWLLFFFKPLQLQGANNTRLRPAPAPDFFFQAAPPPCFFFKRLRLPSPGHD